MVFTGDLYADGGEAIKSCLQHKGIKASFFFTGNFYANSNFKSLIQELKSEGHFLGAHSDKHLLYADWNKRDSLLVTKYQFTKDLKDNYRRMAKFGIRKKDAGYFLPPYEWYNSSISEWTKQLRLQLVNLSPGTLSAADYTYPEMGARYRATGVIYDSILNFERKSENGLNGFILLLHIGTDSRRKDKFYDRLEELIIDLSRKGYNFLRIDEMLK